MINNEEQLSKIESEDQLKEVSMETGDPTTHKAKEESVKTNKGRGKGKGKKKKKSKHDNV